MTIEDSSVKKKLLSPQVLGTTTYERENMGTLAGTTKSEADLRLHDAVYDSLNTEEVQELMEENPDLAYEKDDKNRMPLHILAIGGHEDSVEYAKIILGVVEDSDGNVDSVERRDLLDFSDKDGFTPLHLSAYNWLPELTEAFLKFGAKPLVYNLQGNDTPLHLAAEGQTTNSLECAKLLLEYDKDGSLINSKNRMEQTPLHKAVKEESLPMVDLLMQKQYKLDVNNCISKTGQQTILHYFCQESGESEQSWKIFETLLSLSSKPQFNLQDNNGRTPLHISAIRRLPKITELLNNIEEMDVMKTDTNKRTALHLAAQSGTYPNGYRCVEILLDRKFKNEEADKLILYLYRMRDELEISGFFYAALNCPIATVEKYLKRIPEPQFWLTEAEMTLVYKQCPMAIKGLMDKAFSEQEANSKSNFNNDDNDIILVDFGPITGYKDPVEKLPQQETKFLKNAHWWDFPTQKEILTHSLVELYVAKKCLKLKTIIYAWIIWQLIWLTAYSFLIYTTYTKDLSSGWIPYVSILFMLFHIIMSLTNEIFEWLSIGFIYFISWSNLFQMAQIFLTIFAMSPVVLNSEPTIFQRECAATGILLAHVLAMRDLGRLHEKIGFVIEILKQVLFEILKVLLCCFMLVLGFTHAFKVIFEDEESLKTSFPGPLVKILVMMTGEFEFNETFKEEAGNEDGGRTTRLVLFLFFLICVPVAFFNLLIAISLDRVLELREKAKVGRVIKHLEHIYFIETVLLTLGPLKKLLPPTTVVNWLRNRNVTTARIDGKLQFETLLKEKAKKKVDRRTIKKKSLDIFACLKNVFGSEIDADVRSQMFALASRNSSEIRKRKEEAKLAKVR